jgi:hypothetical protein
MSLHVGPSRVRDVEEILKIQHLCCQAEAATYRDYAIPYSRFAARSARCSAT